MMNMREEVIIYATVKHQGKVRKFSGIPYILHPLEVAQILSTMTDDVEIITAGNKPILFFNHDECPNEKMKRNHAKM